MSEELNPGHYLEMMDRLHIIMSNVNDYCIEHPLTKSNRELERLLEDVIENLWDAYQLVGGLEDKD